MLQYRAIGPYIVPMDKQRPVLSVARRRVLKVNTQGMDRTHPVVTLLQSQRASRLWLKSGKLKVRRKDHIHGCLRQECWVRCLTERLWVLSKKGGSMQSA